MRRDYGVAGIACLLSRRDRGPPRLNNIRSRFPLPQFSYTLSRSLAGFVPFSSSRSPSRLAADPPASTPVSYATFSCNRQFDTDGKWQFGHFFKHVRHFSQRKKDLDGLDGAAGRPPSKGGLDNSDNEELSDEESSDESYDDDGIFEAFRNELAAADDDEDDEEGVAGSLESPSQDSEQEVKEVKAKDDYNWRPWNTKERVKECLKKLKKGPDGRVINVLEVATELDMLLASYIKFRKADDPDRADNSEDDEKYLEGIDIKKFKRLQRRVRDGTYEFQPVVLVPLPKRKIVKLKRKKVKKRHAF